MDQEEGFQDPKMVGGMAGPWSWRRVARDLVREEEFQGPNMVVEILGPWLGRRDSRAPIW
jgi:hypothetical protein